MGSLSVAPLDLAASTTFVDGFPHQFFARLRREAPVWWHEPTASTPDGKGFWVVSRHADVVAVFKDAATFSSGAGGTAIPDSSGAGIMLNQTDDPHHRRLRALVNKGFTPRAIGRLEEDLRRRAQAIVAQIPSGEPFDFVSVVARELPLQAICAVLGVPQADRAELCDLVDQGVAAEGNEIIAMEQVRQLGAYARRLLVAKRAEPTDDILSVIVHAELEDGSRLDDRELRAFFNLLFPAGAETTRSAIAGSVLLFGEHPEQWRLLQDEPAAMAAAVEEIVRWTSPSVYKRRTALVDTELAGRPIAAGDKVTVWEMSANRDEDVFTDPFRFDVTRQPNPHVGFGLGTHFCLGASLARLELRVMLGELAARFDRFELAGPVRWSNSNRLVGPIELPVRAVPVAAGSAGAAVAAGSAGAAGAAGR